MNFTQNWCESQASFLRTSFLRIFVRIFSCEYLHTNAFPGVPSPDGGGGWASHYGRRARNGRPPPPAFSYAKSFHFRTFRIVIQGRQPQRSRRPPTAASFPAFQLVYRLPTLASPEINPRSASVQVLVRNTDVYMTANKQNQQPSQRAGNARCHRRERDLLRRRDARSPRLISSSGRKRGISEVSGNRPGGTAREPTLRHPPPRDAAAFSHPARRRRRRPSPAGLPHLRRRPSRPPAAGLLPPLAAGLLPPFSHPPPPAFSHPPPPAFSHPPPPPPAFSTLRAGLLPPPAAGLPTLRAGLLHLRRRPSPHPRRRLLPPSARRPFSRPPPPAFPPSAAPSPPGLLRPTPPPPAFSHLRRPLRVHHGGRRQVHRRLLRYSEGRRRHQAAAVTR
ncbi:hypothetical protein C7M84_007490 [Penaeus vannamei]|uniref:Uncharacterized protein n=1 Tax=Penaeus vannamei TaxID=6689 RepID=A0A423TCB7_PENVA|nr:hypothetical protein C7M84_007490 [Penaeus vannamei]